MGRRPPRLLGAKQSGLRSSANRRGDAFEEENEGLRILLTNAYLSDRGGSELYIRDLAVRLRRRGRQTIAYSTILGGAAADLRASAVPVIDDLTLLTDPPDVIHGQHILDAAAACLRFPQTPAVYACHGWEPWLETPLILGSVRRYVAISELTRERLVTSGIPPERIAVIPNFVDLERFPRQRDASAGVKRALVYGNAWRPDTPGFLAIREACLRRGIEVEGVGYGFGRPTDGPHELLPSFDVVFALGRSALEAMACGCAVALAGPQGFGGLVTPESFQRQRAANFGLALLVGQPVTPERVAESLDRYDATEVCRVTDLVHAEAGIDVALDRWEEQYRLAIAEGPAPLAEVVADASAYVVKLKALTFHFERDYARLAAELSESKAHVAGLTGAAENLRAELAAMTSERDAASTRLAAMTSERDAASTRLAATTSERDAASTRLADVESHNAALSSWAAELHAKITRLKTPIRKRLGRKIRDAVTPKGTQR
jgi:Glycosyltransferase Family 4